MSKGGLDVEVKGAPELMAKLGAVGAVGLKAALAKLGIALLNKATLVAPVDKGNAGGAKDRKKRAGGRTRGSLKKGAAANIWNEGRDSLTIGSSVSENGEYYPRILDEGGDTYHYRTGPFAGQSLGGWFTKVGDRSEADIAKALDATKQKVLKKWGR